MIGPLAGRTLRCLVQVSLDEDASPEEDAKAKASDAARRAAEACRTGPSVRRSGIASSGMRSPFPARIRAADGKF